MVSRVLKLLGVSGAVDVTVLDGFVDRADVANWAEQDMSICVSSGIIMGTTEGKLLPNNNITRVEAATVAVRLDEYLVKNR